MIGLRLVCGEGERLPRQRLLLCFSCSPTPSKLWERLWQILT